MRRSILFFLILLPVLCLYLFTHPRLLPLLEAAIAINTTACGWFVFNAFAKPERSVAVRSGTRTIVVAMILTLNSIVFMGAYLRHAQAKRPFILLAASAPSLGWTAFDGSTHKLEEFSGRPVVLHFWATWCVPCRKEFPKFLAYAVKHPDVTFIAIDASDDTSKAQHFIKASGALGGNVSLARDTDGAISNDLFRIPAYPTTIFINTHGQMRREFTGSVDWEGGGVESAAAEAKAR